MGGIQAFFSHPQSVDDTSDIALMPGAAIEVLDDENLISSGDDGPPKKKRKAVVDSKGVVQISPSPTRRASAKGKPLTGARSGANDKHRKRSRSSSSSSRRKKKKKKKS